MVFKRSEYGLKYKKSYLEKNIPVYYDNVAYRTHRRELEHAHTPLSWDFEDTPGSKTSSEEEVSEEIQKTLQVLEINQQEEVQAEDNNEKLDVIAKDNNDQQDLVDEAKSKLEKYQSQNNMNVDNDKEVKVNKECPDSIPCFGDDNHKGKADMLAEDLKLPLKLDEGKKRKNRISSKTRERPKSSPAYKPPFLAYGCGDKERETGVKRSFNVRASNDVYPAAMKALVNLHEQQKKRENNRRCLSARERKRKALILEKAWKEVAGWQSEYRRMYPQYNHDEYARSASRLQNRPQCFKPYRF